MANPTSTPLPLADIHLQSAPNFWPLPWGWWLVILITLSVVIAGSIWLYRRHQQRLALREAKRQLKHIDNLSALNTLLKRAALSYFPRETVAGLTGQAWLAFLDAQLPEKRRGFLAYEASWQKNMFANTPLAPHELTELKHLAQQWLQFALPPKKQEELENV